MLSKLKHGYLKIFPWLMTNGFDSCRVASDGARTVSVHIHLKDDGEAWDDEDEDDPIDSDVVNQTSPEQISHPSHWSQAFGEFSVLTILDEYCCKLAL
jgi:hypothetical protein